MIGKNCNALILIIIFTFVYKLIARFPDTLTLTTTEMLHGPPLTASITKVQICTYPFINFHEWNKNCHSFYK